MATTDTKEESNNLMEMKWSSMVVLSVIFHVAIFSVVLFVPEAMPTRRFEGVVYSVNLVEMPAGVDLKLKGTRSKTRAVKKGAKVVKKRSPATRIRTEKKKKKKPVVIAKRTVKAKTPTIKKPKVSSSELIDRAVSKIEKKVKTEEKTHDEKTHVDRAISKLESEVSTPQSPGPAEGRPVGGIPIQFYQMEVEERIKSNWSYPVALRSGKDLEAVVVVMVKRDGSILKSEMKRGSSDAIFDESVLRAVKRSDPLPPFPEGYRKSYEEFVINFNLKDLEDS